MPTQSFSLWETRMTHMLSAIFTLKFPCNACVNKAQEQAVEETNKTFKFKHRHEDYSFT